MIEEENQIREEENQAVGVMSRPKAAANLIAALHTLYLKQMYKSFHYMDDISAHLTAEGQIDLLDRNFQKMSEQVKVFLQIKQSKSQLALNKINLLCIQKLHGKVQRVAELYNQYCDLMQVDRPYTQGQL